MYDARDADDPARSHAHSMAEEAQETSLPEENQEVDAGIQLCHKIFLLSNPTLCKDVAGLSEEVKQTVLSRGELARTRRRMNFAFTCERSCVLCFALAPARRHLTPSVGRPPPKEEKLRSPRC